MANENESNLAQDNEEEIEFASLDNLEADNPMGRGDYSGEENREPEEQSAVEDNTPPKFKGKSTEEIMEMYRNLEKEFGRKNNELGELRGKVDTLIGLQREGQQPAQQGSGKSGDTSNRTEVTEDEFWENPKDAVRKMLETSEYSQKLNQIENHITEQRRAQDLEQFKSKHPDFLDIVQDQQFQSWVTSTPKRQELYQQADNHDYAAADELLSIWKQLNGNKNNSSGEQDTDSAVREMADRESLKEAQIERSSGGGKKSKGKYFRRADIIDLKVNNPQRYRALQDEIMQAYAEGRVK